MDAKYDLPWWVLPPAMSALAGGIALIVVYHSSVSHPSPINGWFVAAVALMGALSGLIAHFWMRSQNRGRGVR